MNLLMVTGDRSILEGRRGAFWHTLQGLRAYWERIDILCPRPRVAAASAGEVQTALRSSGGGSVFFYSNPHGILTQPSWIVAKGRELHEQYKYAAMTIHEYPPFYNGRGALRLAAEMDIPTLLEIHHIVGFPSAASVSEWAGRRFSRWFLPQEAHRATAVRTVNGEVERMLISWGVPEEKIEVLPSFYLDREAIAGVEKQEKRYDLAFCARLVPNKGLGKVLEALTSLPGTTLVVIGDGPKRSSYERYAQDLGVYDQVKFVGWLPEQRDVLKTLKSARVFLMNSTSEGGPRSALEAMACGLPVIATPVGVMPDVLKEGVNGLFTTGEAPDLVNCIEALLTNPAVCDTMGAEASKILDHFSRDFLIRQYSDFLRTLL
ncbi:hypothetical protein COU79_01835 [Candidatus Peregrinibacteria bacterium CG10_big_fil_rev_8_21_14_0_10_54_7]|nr:MAG: hypothetical protein COU79_01835 [Candidatus Peregrinibacteria bacterium CG10_big_fil_rev_8_21_14_0_10_54_7]